MNEGATLVKQVIIWSLVVFPVRRAVECNGRVCLVIDPLFDVILAP